MKTVNAKIESMSLGYEDHGIMTIMLTLDFGGSMQGFGGYGLDGAEDLQRWIKELLRVVGVERWEDLKGKYVRVEKEEDWNGRITQIGHFLENKWFDSTNN